MIIKLWQNPEIESTLTVYPRPDGRIRPAMLVIPGGGYGCVCEETEGAPIARRFEELGFQTFVLHYRVAPHRYPAPQQDAFRAIRLIRANAARWGVNPANLAVCGFSAGGHLAACCGTLYNDIDAVDGDEADRESQRPDALLLCYPVISFLESPHLGSGKNLLGDRFDELKAALSLETRVTADTPPAFVWHTVADQIVPYANSQCFARALWNAGRPCELHMYPTGPHGMQLGYGRSDIAAWPEQAKEFLRLSAHFRYAEPPAKRRTVILTFDDAVKNHRTRVAPLLKEYGFGATFYPCRFSRRVAFATWGASPLRRGAARDS